MSNKNQHAHNFYCTVFVNKQKGMSTLNFIAFTPYKILSSTNTFKKKRVGVVKQKLQQKSTLACALVEASRLARARHVLATPSVLRQAIASSPNPHSFKKEGRWCETKTATKKHTCVCFGRSKQTRASKARPCDTQRIATSNRVLTEPPQFQKRGSVV